MNKEKILFLGLLTLAGIVMIIASNVMNSEHGILPKEDASQTRIIIQSPESLEIEESNETVTATNSMNVVVRQGGQEIRNADVELSQQVQLRASSGKQITVSQAIAKARATEEVQEFLKWYPDAGVSVVEGYEGCELVAVTEDAKIKCTRELLKKDGLIVAYWVGENLEGRAATAVRIGIDAQTGEILAKYPKLEYIKNPEHCEKDNDCIHLRYVDTCANFVGERYISSQSCAMSSSGTACGMHGEFNWTTSCKCINNTCIITEKT
ncbi:MAG: hypothetical protein MSIBF_05160 [Candidatus Altiarchaeales archaeon IMC4]|nr:MAG: hypothetical protein MSIBF_05160 [Candidatus Altiarchaeales archaeon IMC4]